MRETRITDPAYEYGYPTSTFRPFSRYPWPNKIAYVSKRGSNWNIYTNNENGTRESNPLVSGSAEKKKLSWSPDVKWISYIQGDQLYRVNASGTPAPQVATPTGQNEIVGHGWLDDTKIIFARRNAGGTYDLVSRNADGSGSDTMILTQISLIPGLFATEITLAITDTLFRGGTNTITYHLTDMKVSHWRNYVALLIDCRILRRIPHPSIPDEFTEETFAWPEAIRILDVKNGWQVKKDILMSATPLPLQLQPVMKAISWAASDDKLYVAAKAGSTTGQEPIPVNQMEIFSVTLYLSDPAKPTEQTRYTTNSWYDSYPDITPYWFYPTRR